MNGRPPAPESPRAAALVGLLRHRSTAVWALLAGATLVSWWLGDGHGEARAATVGVLVVAFAKVGLVGHHFMELRGAPVALRAVFGGWCVVVCVALVGIYLIA